MSHQTAFELEEQNKLLARRLLEKTINARDLECLGEIIAADCLCQSLPGRGPDAYRQHVETMLSIYPDLRVTVDGQIAEDEIVATWFTATGTHAGEWMGVAPTHRKLTLRGVNVQRMRHGRIVEHWGGSNSLEALLEIGLVRWKTPSVI